MRKEELMIHQYKLNGFNIVIDVYSGSVHVVDDVAYDIIQLFCDEEKETIIKKMLDKYADEQDVNREELEEVIDDIEELKKQRKLFTDDIYEPNAFDLKNRHTEVKALCLHVAHTCNLNCTYCFASQGNFNGERGLMSFDTGKRALDFLVENSGDRRNLENSMKDGGCGECQTSCQSACKTSCGVANQECEKKN